MTNLDYSSSLSEVVRETERDPVNITVYGNPVLDVIVDVSEGARHVVERDAIGQIADIRPNGNLEFKPDTYVCFFLGHDPIVWGPFNPENRQSVYSVGEKYSISIRCGDDAYKVFESDESTIAYIPGPHLRLGGGGANVLFGFYDVFAQLKVELIATVEQNPPSKRGRLDPFVIPLTRKIGPYTKIPLYAQPGINLAIEGLGSKKDRIIFTTLIQANDDVIESMPTPRGKAIMVNTIYSPRVALDALSFACEPDRLGILALTKSLCNKKKMDPCMIDQVVKNHPHIKINKNEVNSVYDFVIKSVLCTGACTLIMNEAEIEHLTDVAVGFQRRDFYLTSLGGVIEALKKIRTFQESLKERVYVTLGADGAIVLSEDDKLIYCGIVDDRSRAPTGKTAIGDTYATFILALETIGNYIRLHNIPAQDVCKAAAAGADSGVYDGFGNLAVYKVNRFLGDSNRRLLDIGPLYSFPCDKWKEVGISEMRDSDWESISRRSYMANNLDFTPGTLQEVIGRAFLRV
jgi:hypothetical protein